MPEDIKDNLTGDRGGKESPNFFIKGAEKANVGRMDNKEITKEEIIIKVGKSEFGDIFKDAGGTGNRKRKLDEVAGGGMSNDDIRRRADRRLGVGRS